MKTKQWTCAALASLALAGCNDEREKIRFPGPTVQEEISAMEASREWREEKAALDQSNSEGLTPLEREMLQPALARLEAEVFDSGMLRLAVESVEQIQEMGRIRVEIIEEGLDAERCREFVDLLEDVESSVRRRCETYEQAIAAGKADDEDVLAALKSVVNLVAIERAMARQVIEAAGD
jgi:hypothetical protein